MGPIKNFDKYLKCVPTKGTISRWRLLIDTAFMKLNRRRTAKLLGEGQTTARYMQADASMQHRHEYEHVLVRSILTRDLPAIFVLSNDLINLWSHNIWDDEEAQLLETDWMRRIAEAITQLSLPTAHLGSGRKSLNFIFNVFVGNCSWITETRQVRWHRCANRWCMEHSILVRSSVCTESSHKLLASFGLGFPQITRTRYELQSSSRRVISSKMSKCLW